MVTKDLKMDLAIADTMQSAIEKELREDQQEQKFAALAQGLVDLAKTTTENLEDTTKAVKSLLLQHKEVVDKSLEQFKADFKEPIDNINANVGEIFNEQELLKQTLHALIVLFLVPPSDTNQQLLNNCRQALLKFNSSAQGAVN